MSVINVLFPKARAELVRLLFADPDKEFHLRELSRRSCLSIGTIQTEVAKLSAAELLVGRRDGNRLYFSANTRHPVFPEMHGLALKTTGLAEQLASAMRGLPGIEIAFVFGSTASGKAVAGSDVDVLIIGAAGLRSLAPRLRTVATAIGREINPHVLSRETFRAKARAGDAFVTNVLASPKIWIIGDADELGKLA